MKMKLWLLKRINATGYDVSNGLSLQEVCDQGKRYVQGAEA